MVAGTGAVQTLTTRGYEEVAARARRLRVVHARARSTASINGGDLEILVLMQNAGLPEAGDMVITFPPEVLATAESYAAAATLPEDERTTFGTGDAARARRDLAVPTFNKLRAGDRGRRSRAAPRVPRGRRPPRPAAHRRLDQALARRPAQGGRAHRRPPPSPRRGRRRPPRRGQRPPPPAAARRAPHGLLRHPRHLPPLTRRRSATADEPSPRGNGEEGGSSSPSGAAAVTCRRTCGARRHAGRVIERVAATGRASARRLQRLPDARSRGAPPHATSASHCSSLRSARPIHPTLRRRAYLALASCPTVHA